MGVEGTAKETQLQTQLAAEKAAMVTRHKSAEMLAMASADNAVVKFGKASARKTEYALFICKESMLNMPGCASVRQGAVTVKNTTVNGAEAAKSKVTGT